MCRKDLNTLVNSSFSARGRLKHTFFLIAYEPSRNVVFVGCPKLHVVKRQCNHASADQPSHNLVLSDVQNCGGGQPREIVVKRILLYVADEPFRRTC